MTFFVRICLLLRFISLPVVESIKISKFRLVLSNLLLNLKLSIIDLVKYILSLIPGNENNIWDSLLLAGNSGGTGSGGTGSGGVNNNHPNSSNPNNNSEDPDEDPEDKEVSETDSEFLDDSERLEDDLAGVIKAIEGDPEALQKCKEGYAAFFDGTDSDQEALAQIESYLSSELQIEEVAQEKAYDAAAQAQILEGASPPESLPELQGASPSQSVQESEDPNIPTVVYAEGYFPRKPKRGREDSDVDSGEHDEKRVKGENSSSNSGHQFEWPKGGSSGGPSNGPSGNQEGPKDGSSGNNHKSLEDWGSMLLIVFSSMAEAFTVCLDIFK